MGQRWVCCELFGHTSGRYVQSKQTGRPHMVKNDIQPLVFACLCISEQFELVGRSNNRKFNLIYGWIWISQKTGMNCGKINRKFNKIYGWTRWLVVNAGIFSSAFLSLLDCFSLALFHIHPYVSRAKCEHFPNRE